MNKGQQLYTDLKEADKIILRKALELELIKKGREKLKEELEEDWKKSREKGNG